MVTFGTSLFWSCIVIFAQVLPFFSVEILGGNITGKGLLVLSVLVPLAVLHKYIVIQFKRKIMLTLFILTATMLSIAIAGSLIIERVVTTVSYHLFILLLVGLYYSSGLVALSLIIVIVVALMYKQKTKPSESGLKTFKLLCYNFVLPTFYLSWIYWSWFIIKAVISDIP